jgi:thiol-disulfide isomerase/thioredoxin
VAREFGGQVRFVVENYGDSSLAKRFGVTRYPAIFVDEVLVATPKDFGFYGKGEGGGEGRYAPIRTAENQNRFRADLARLISLALAGRAGAAPSRTAAEPLLPSMPGVALTDLDGRRVTREELAGRAVIVDFWATWCPPCRGALAWLGEVKRRHGDRVVVVAVALESDEAAVRDLAGSLGLPFRWAVGGPDVARAFGDVTGLPTLFLFGPDGRGEAVFYGSNPAIHAEAERKLAALLER